VQFSAESLFNSLKDRISELKAVFLVGASGAVRFHAKPGSAFDVESFAAEYATLFRIASRTALDTAMGDAYEQILISDKALLVVRRFGTGNVAIFVCGPDQQLGRLRFEIRSLAERLPHSVI